MFCRVSHPSTSLHEQVMPSNVLLPRTVAETRHDTTCHRYQYVVTSISKTSIRSVFEIDFGKKHSLECEFASVRLHGGLADSASHRGGFRYFYPVIRAHVPVNDAFFRRTRIGKLQVERPRHASSTRMTRRLGRETKIKIKPQPLSVLSSEPVA